MYSIPGGSDRNVITCTKEEVFIIIRNSLKEDLSKQIEILEAAWTEKTNRNILIHEDAKPILAKFFNTIRTMWQRSNKHEKTFKKKYNNWLSDSIQIIIYDTEDLSTQSKRRDRSLEFSAISDRSKRRKTKELRTSNIEELADDTQMSFCSLGQLDYASKVVKDVTLTNPTRVSKYITVLTSEIERILSNDAALSVLIEHKFSKRIYQGIRKIGKENNCKLYPSYNNVLKAKKRCYPPRTSITITESRVEIKLQALLDHTVERILFLQREVISTLTIENVKNLHLICKWGCDKSIDKQKFTEAGKSDENMFVTSLVPLQLVCKAHESNTEIVVWKNPRPSSSRFCRPIKLQFLYENVESTDIEIDDIKQQVESLVPFTTQVHGMEICVKYSMTFTMIDSKICNAMFDMKLIPRCYLCGATSRDFNNIDEILQKKVTETNLQFGLSTLHAWIRFFECCLHLSYRLKIKKYRIRTEEEENIKEECKRVIQKGFRLQLGLIVDRTKPGHYRSINDGNTAWRFFENSSISATITGVSECLINRFYVILQAISSGHNIKYDKFREYALETARKFVELYPWYYMPISVHKLLIHGSEIIASALLPIGQLSEDVQKANKDIKRFHEDFSRKCSRENIMQDVFNRLMVTSDPYISSIRKLPQKPLKSLSPEVVELLDFPTDYAATTVTNEKYTDFDSESSGTGIDSDVYCESESDFDFCL